MDVVTLGEALIDLSAITPGVSLAEATQFLRVAAGAPGNVAAGVVRLGLTSTFITRVGSDAFGDAIVREFTEQGVNTSHFVRDVKRRTGLAFVSIDPHGERDFLFYYDPLLDLTLAAHELKIGELSRTRAFHFGSISLISPDTRGTTFHLAQQARKNGALCTYDPNLRPALWPSKAEMMSCAEFGFSEAHVAKIAEDELSALAVDAQNELEAVNSLFARHQLLELIAVTCGSKGCTGYLRGLESVSAAGYRVSSIDSTGAGDAFMAGLIVSLLALGEDPKSIFRHAIDKLPRLLSVANACGALATTVQGAAATPINWEAVEKMMN